MTSRSHSVRTTLISVLFSLCGVISRAIGPLLEEIWLEIKAPTLSVVGHTFLVTIALISLRTVVEVSLILFNETNHNIVTVLMEVSDVFLVLILIIYFFKSCKKLLESTF